VTATTSNLVDVSNSSTVEWEGQAPNDEFLITQMNIDANFMATTGMSLASGRNFSAAIAGDTTDKFGRYMLNETAAQRMGYTNESVLGKKVKFWGFEGEIIGVLKDFHFRPLNKTIEPFIFRFRPKEFYFDLLVKLTPNDMPTTIAAIEQAYKKVDTDHPFSYGFVDQSLETQYKAEQRTGRTVLYFAILTIFISCLGLFGLVAFAAEQRTKEIGVRKVLGASVASVVGLLSKDFLKLVLIALVIASPIAYTLMQKWLADFAYRIDIQWWMFVLAGAVAMVIAFLTVAGQAVRTAMVNPVKSLRND
jgi:ABC-type antimicrobial peptide transport system permease subunit